MPARRLFFALAFASFTVAAGTAAAEPARVSVYAAASLTGVMRDIDEAAQAQGKPACTCVHAATSVLARQIERGAPADIFISANPQWMAYVVRKLKLHNGPRLFAGNRLVLIAPAGQPLTFDFGSGRSLAEALDGGWLALADPDHVPAGIYAMKGLQHLGLWHPLSGRVARAQNVRAALALVIRKEARAGVVYESDAIGEKRVDMVDFFPSGSHPEVRYMAAAIADAPAPHITAYLDFLTSPAVAAILSRHGLRPPGN